MNVFPEGRPYSAILIWFINEKIKHHSKRLPFLPMNIPKQVWEHIGEEQIDLRRYEKK